MERRKFMLGTASIAVGALALAGCTTTATTSASTHPDTAAGKDKRRSEIDAAIDPTLQRLYSTVKGSHELVSKARGVLVFPSVIAAGFGVGGQYGEGALQVHSATSGYYSIGSVSVGLQIGAQSKAIIILFMTDDALNKFRSSHGWAVGADASVAVMRVGANGQLDVTAPTGPVEAFVLTNAGLMANLTLEGTKITPLDL